MELILASGSPRRKELLALITPEFTVHTSDVDESVISAPAPELLVQKLAQAKCRAVAAQHPAACVLGCDTVVDVDGEVLGKPHGAADARRMMRLLSGRAHRVMPEIWPKPSIPISMTAFLSSGSRRSRVWGTPISLFQFSWVLRVLSKWESTAQTISLVLGLPTLPVMATTRTGRLSR